MIAVSTELARGVAELSQTATGSLVAAVWQGVLLAGAAWLGLKLLPKTPAAVRFAIWFGVFALVTVLPAISLWPRSVSAAATGGHGAWLTLDPRWSLAIAGVWVMASVWRAGQLTVAALRVRGLWKRARAVGVDSIWSGEAATHPSGAWMGHPAVGASGLHPTHRDDAAMNGAPKLGEVVRRAQVCVSDEVDKPTVIGFFAPKILIPGWLLEKMTAAELEQVVLHESGHLGRADDWMNLLQKIALVVFPLNPALAWIERRLCFERELACDEWVLKAVAGRPGSSTAYAACLASMAEYRLERRGLPHGLALALGLLGRESELTRRVKRILRRGDGMRPAHAKLVLGGAMLGLVVGAAGLERCPQLVGFAPRQGTGSREQGLGIREQGTGALAAGYQPVMLRSNTIPAQQFRSIGDAPAVMARMHRRAKLATPQGTGMREQGTIAMAARQVGDQAVVSSFGGASAEKVDVVQKSPLGRSTQAPRPRMIRTVQQDVRQAQYGDVVVTQWVTVTQWRDGDGTRMVLTTARQMANGTDQSTMQDGVQQPVAPYAAVPVRGGWLLFQL